MYLKSVNQYKDTFYTVHQSKHPIHKLDYSRLVVEILRWTQKAVCMGFFDSSSNNRSDGCAATNQSIHLVATGSLLLTFTL